MQIEEWRDVVNCSGYKVSNLGRVVGPRGNIIKLQQYKGHGGYWFFRMPHKKYTKSIHRMVAEAFIPNPDNLPEVNHLYGDKEDNRACVLEWCTRKQNMQHAHRTGIKVNKGNRKIFDALQITIIKECFEKKFTNVSIAKYFNCHHSTLAYIRHGKRKHYPVSI